MLEHVLGQGRVADDAAALLADPRLALAQDGVADPGANLPFRVQFGQIRQLGASGEEHVSDRGAVVRL